MGPASIPKGQAGGPTEGTELHAQGAPFCTILFPPQFAPATSLPLQAGKPCKHLAGHLAGHWGRLGTSVCRPAAPPSARVRKWEAAARNWRPHRFANLVCVRADTRQMTAGYLQDLITTWVRLGRRSRGDCSSSVALSMEKKKYTQKRRIDSWVWQKGRDGAGGISSPG